MRKFKFKMQNLKNTLDPITSDYAKKDENGHFIVREDEYDEFVRDISKEIKRLVHFHMNEII
jgi:uncharacterized protein YeeX (DUF496 family)